MSDAGVDEDVVLVANEEKEVLRVGEPDVSHIDIKKARFPCCLVWTPLPIVAWLVPFIGHVGICREDGVILDFAGPCFVNVDNFAFGSTAKYLRLNPEKCCFPPHLSGHTCSDPFRHTDKGTAISWDDGVETTMRNYQNKLYNLFTCNCHSFVANALNRMAYRGSIKWNIVNVLALVFFKGQYVSYWALVRTYAPFVMVLILGLVMTGWPFLIAWSIFVGLLVTWFLIGTYCLRGLIES
ncbi:hypothetical protein CY35_05G094200 [Sphagnum magellanicum]|nr:hypothetical protein CY35_05G094200 [Sphagnum magellanicum]KAH9562878.1 hypothetical protein CY35_05G094200 [Sphagnum magellanicum]